MTSRLSTIVYALLLLALGAASAWWLRSYVDVALDSRAWPSASGRVLEARVTEGVSDPLEPTGPLGIPQTSHAAQLVYEYRVRGRGYTGTRVAALDVGSNIPQLARGVVDRYPAGTRVEVRYDPRSPSIAVLEPGLTWPLIACGLVPFFFVASGLGALRKAFR